MRAQRRFPSDTRWAALTLVCAATLFGGCAAETGDIADPAETAIDDSDFDDRDLDDPDLNDPDLDDPDLDDPDLDDPDLDDPEEPADSAPCVPNPKTFTLTQLQASMQRTDTVAQRKASIDAAFDAGAHTISWTEIENIEAVQRIHARPGRPANLKYWRATLYPSRGTKTRSSS